MRFYKKNKQSSNMQVLNLVIDVYHRYSLLCHVLCITSLYSTIQSLIYPYSAMQYITSLYFTLHSTTFIYFTIQCITYLHSTIWYITSLYSTKNEFLCILIFSESLLFTLKCCVFFLNTLQQSSIWVNAHDIKYDADSKNSV